MPSSTGIQSSSFTAGSSVKGSTGGALPLWTGFACTVSISRAIGEDLPDEGVDTLGETAASPDLDASNMLPLHVGQVFAPPVPGFCYSWVSTSTWLFLLLLLSQPSAYRLLLGHHANLLAHTQQYVSCPPPTNEQCCRTPHSAQCFAELLRPRLHWDPSILKSNSTQTLQWGQSPKTILPHQQGIT